MDFASDDVKTGSRKKVNHASGATIGKAKIVGLNQYEGFFYGRANWVGYGMIEEPAVGVGVSGPEF